MSKNKYGAKGFSDNGYDSAFSSQNTFKTGSCFSTHPVLQLGGQGSRGLDFVPVHVFPNPVKLGHQIT